MPGSTGCADPRAEIAIGWMVELASGDMSDEQYRRFEAWLKADPRNESVWITLQEGLMPLGVAARQRLPSRALTDRLRTINASRRTLMTGVLSCVGLIPIGMAAMDRFVPLADIMADQVTRTGEKSHLVLADGSGLVLGPRTAVDILFTKDVRKLRLHGGEVMVKVTSQATPFHLVAGSEALRAETGQFIVAKRRGALSFTGIEGQGAVGSRPAHLLGPGDRVLYSNGRSEKTRVDLEVTTAWLDGLLIAKDRAVGAIIDDIRPYFPGVIRVDPVIDAMRATAVLDLGRPNHALDTLAASLQLSIARITPYWVSIGPRIA